MKNQKAVQLVKSSNKIVPSKSASTPSAESGEVVKFNEAGMPQLEVWLEDETIWLTQKQMAELFGCAMENIIHHLKNIYTEEELIEEATTKEFLVVRFEGKRQVSRKVKHYNLDAIISVGYRVNSKRGVKFRQWYPPRKRGSRFVASQAERKRVPSNIGLEGISVARACARPEDWQVGETHDGCRAFDRHHHLYADARIAGEPRTNRVSCLTVFAAKVPRFIDLSPSYAFQPQQRGKSAAPYILIPRPLFNHNKVLGASDSPRWGASQSGFGLGGAISTSGAADDQVGVKED